MVTYSNYKSPYDLNDILKKHFLDPKGIISWNLDIKNSSESSPIITSLTLAFIDTEEMIEKKKRFQEYLILKEEFEKWM